MSSTDSEFTLYIGIYLILLLSLVGMVYTTIRAKRRKQSVPFLLAIWVGYLLILVFGGLANFLTIRNDQNYWVEYFSEITRAYANAVEKLDHWKLEYSYSEWSSIVDPQDPEKIIVAAEPRSVLHPVPSRRFFAAPTGLTAVWKDDAEIDFRWDPVEGANGYQIQRTQTPEDPDSWVYVHRVFENRLTDRCDHPIKDDPARTAPLSREKRYYFRVRAIYMTPEDDPVYAKIKNLFDSGVKDSEEVGFIYTMRLYNDDYACFIVGPSIDVDISDPTKERGVPIGKKYPLLPVMREALGLGGVRPHGEVDTALVDDVWGRWIKGVEPIFAPDGKLDGFLGVDFPADRWRNKIIVAQVYPTIFLVFVLLSYFAGVGLIVYLRQAEEKQLRISEELRETVDKLTIARKIAVSAGQAKSEFLINMSHEVRTPMNAVLNFAEQMWCSLKQHCPQEKQQQCDEWMTLISQNGNDLLHMIDDILDFIKASDDQFKVEQVPVSLQELLDELETEMSKLPGKDSGIELRFIRKRSLPEWILSDPKRIRQILVHLIKNGIKFTESGSVSVIYGSKLPHETRYHLLSETIPATNSPSKKSLILYFEILDTGIGIDPDQLSHLFEPFWQADGSLTRQHGGAGLGLSVSKRIAQRLNGDIFVESEPGKGSSFTFAFRAPLCEEGPKTSQQKESENVKEPTIAEKMNKPLEGFHILAVDDVRINLVVLVSQLRELGAELTEAENGRVAIEKYQAAEEAGTPFDVILMDMQMPVMDGYEATRTLRERGSRCPIIAVTAHALAGDCAKTLEAGCDAYLTKPVERGRFLETILTLCRPEKT